MTKKNLEANMLAKPLGIPARGRLLCKKDGFALRKFLKNPWELPRSVLGTWVEFFHS